MQALIKNRDVMKWTYSPAANKDADKNNDVTPIDLFDRTKRDAAFELLFKDALADAKRAQRAALSGPALPPLIRFANGLVDLRKLEYAATKAETESSALLQPLAEHAQRSITNVLNEMGRQTDAIDRSANERVDQVTNVRDPNNPGRMIQQRTQVRRGLSGNDVSNLNNIISTCNAIPGACRDLVNALGNAGNGLNNAVNDANRISRHASNVVNDNYRNLNRNW
jgi:hypothetical protein